MEVHLRFSRRNGGDDNEENKSVTFSKDDVKRIGEMVLEGF